MQNNFGFDEVVAFFGIIIMGLFPGIMIGGCLGNNSTRQQAVQHNAAYYSTDKQTGSYQFNWGQPNVNERSAEQAD